MSATVRKTRKFLVPVAGVVAVGLVLSGCAGSETSDPDVVTDTPAEVTDTPTAVTGMPQDWLTKTAQGWPESQGYGEQVPALSTEQCAVLDSVPEFLGVEAESTSSGYGRYGFGEDSYRYVCELWAPDKYAMLFQVLQASGDMEGPFAVEELLNEPSTEVQENTSTTLTSGGLEVHVKSTWYPTNPQGAFTALYYDVETESMVSVDVNSLSVEDYEATTPQQVADLLVEFMAAN